MNKMTLISGAVFGLLTVVIGAFGAHLFKPMLMDYGHLDTFETAVRYQAYHALALLIVGVMSEKYESKWFKYSTNSFIAGIIIFSGSLYVLSLFNIKFMGAITPIGGVFLIFGWLFLLVAFVKRK